MIYVKNKTKRETTTLGKISLNGFKTLQKNTTTDAIDAH
jgi:hypothetical protein